MRKPLDPTEFCDSLREKMTSALVELNDALPSLDWVEIADQKAGAIKLIPIEAAPEPRNLRRIKNEVARRWSAVPLIDILKGAILRAGCLARARPRWPPTPPISDHGIRTCSLSGILAIPGSWESLRVNGRALIRSRLWEPASQALANELPALGEVAAQFGLDIDPRLIPDSARAWLWAEHTAVPLTDAPPSLPTSSGPHTAAPSPSPG
ncbi:hypothetical protein [Streptosporangium sp. NPDC000396]|uniref:hypothetical protein n=1 Tax=Streptosporangium sp. NPDC000396 TaxID=3366185 RepID=UPI0036C9BD04